MEIGRHYAGDKLRFAVLRGNATRRSAKWSWWRNSNTSSTAFSAFCRCAPATKGGVTVRYVYPESPAAAAGIAAGDVLVSFQGEPIQNRIELWQKMGALEPGSGGPNRSPQGRRPAEAEGYAWPNCPRVCRRRNCRRPEQRPARGEPNRPAVGAVPLKVPEFPNEVWAYVPERLRTGTCRMAW